MRCSIFRDENLCIVTDDSGRLVAVAVMAKNTKGHCIEYATGAEEKIKESKLGGT